jgi:peptide/nickel transport system substrate-binding protein
MQRRSSDRRLTATISSVLTIVAALALANCSSDDTDGASSVPPAATDAPLTTSGDDTTNSSGDTVGSEPEDTSTVETTAPSAGAPTVGGDATILIPDAIDGWDPAFAIQLSTWQILKEVTEPLLRITGDGSDVAPGLAAEWAYDADAMTVTVTLQENAKFSDGTPVTSADVAFSADLWKAGPLYGPSYAGIASVETPDDQTAVFTLTAPDSSFVALLSWPTSGIVPTDFGGRSAEEFYAQPVGAGPFMIQSEKPGEEIVLERNPEYYAADSVYLDTVTYRVVNDNNQRLVQLEGGTADLVERVPLDLFSQVRGGTILEMPSASVSLIGFSAASSPTDNADFRKAVSLSVDRQALIDSVYSGKAEPNNGILPASLPGSTGSTSNWSDLDPTAATTALEASGYDGSPVELLVDSSRGIDLLAAQAIQPMLEATGIATDIVTVDSATFLGKLSAGEASMFIGNYSAGSPTLNDPLGFMLVTQTLYTGFNSDLLLPAMGAVAAAADPSDSSDAVAAYEDDIYANTFVAPLLSPWVIGALSERLHGLELSPYSFYDLRALWVD